jgi:hypothetical protein
MTLSSPEVAQSSEALLTCPFCDGEAQTWTSNDFIQVFCRVCRCGTSLKETQEAAITAWNTRPATVPKDIADKLAEAGALLANMVTRDGARQSDDVKTARNRFEVALKEYQDQSS